MKILVVGTGGVGAAVAAVAQRRDFFERITFADLDPARPQALVDRLDDDALRRCAGRRFRPGERRRARARGRRRPQRDRPALQPADLRSRLRDPLHVPRHGDVALEPGDAARPGAARPARALGRCGAARAGRDRRRARPLGRLRPLRGRPPLRRDRRGRRPRRRRPRGRGLRVRADLLDLDDDRGVPEPAARSGSASAAGTRPNRSASPRCSTSRRGSARSSASTSSTRRSCSCRAGSSATA